MNRLLLVVCLSILILALPQETARAQSPETIEKTYCTLAIGYSSLDALKAALDANAKRLAVNEFFGELISASTLVENAILTSDQIQASSLGLIRITGSATYFNGEDFGEFCVSIRVYVTDSDLALFEPVEITKRYCLANDDLSASSLSALVRSEVVIRAVLDFDPSIETTDRARLSTLVQRINYSEAGFLPDTNTYCATMAGFVTPIEVEVFALGALSEEATATPTPTPTATATGTALPSQAPTHFPATTPTITPTTTPSPPSTPTATPTLIPTATEVCAPTGVFAGTWQANRNSLGCAMGEVSLDVITIQPFEHGYLIWRKSYDILIAIPANMPWSTHANTWDGGDPFTCDEARAHGGPVMGFGRLWCENAALRISLGAPLGGEEPNEFAEVQSFANGQILEARGGWHILLFQSGAWATTR